LFYSYCEQDWFPDFFYWCIEMLLIFACWFCILQVNWIC
jgi:hypothetical protein